MPIDAASMDLRATFPNDLKYDLEGVGSSAMEVLRYTVDIRSPAPREDVVRVLRRAEVNCHAASSLREPVPVVPALRLNGEDVPFGEPPP